VAPRSFSTSCLTLVTKTHDRIYEIKGNDWTPNVF
jgi:hypothetical protein